MWRQSRFGNGRLKCALADMFSRLKPLDPKWTPLHVRWVWFFIDFRNSRMKIMNSLNGIAFSISINRCDTGSMILLSSSLVSVKLVGIKFSGRLENDVEKKLSSSILKGFSPPPLAKESETPTRTAHIDAIDKANEYLPLYCRQKIYCNNIYFLKHWWCFAMASFITFMLMQLPVFSNQHKYTHTRENIARSNRGELHCSARIRFTLSTWAYTRIFDGKIPLSASRSIYLQ